MTGPGDRTGRDDASEGAGAPSGGFDHDRDVEARLQGAHAQVHLGRQPNGGPGLSRPLLDHLHGPADCNTQSGRGAALRVSASAARTSDSGRPSASTSTSGT